MTTTLQEAPAATPPATLMTSRELAGTRQVPITAAQPVAAWWLRADEDATIEISWRRAAGSSLEPGLTVRSGTGEQLAQTQPVAAEGPQFWVKAPDGPQAGPQSPTAGQQAAADLLKIPVTAGQVIQINGYGRSNTTGSGELTVTVRPDPRSGPVGTPTYKLIDNRRYFLTCSSSGDECAVHGTGASVAVLARLLLESKAVPLAALSVLDTVTDETVEPRT